MRLATATQMRRIERLAVERGDTEAALMERAGLAAADWIRRELWPEQVMPPITVVCGRGNNGGDGFVLAAALAAVSRVTVVLAQGQPTAQPAQQYAARLPAAVTVLDYAAEPYLCAAAVNEAAVLVDAVYGIGFHGELPAQLLPLFAQMNAAPGIKVAVDMPSGLAVGERDDVGGAVPAAAFRADVTLTFTAKKQRQSSPLCGRVEVLPIGIPADIVAQVLEQESADVTRVADPITPEQVRACFTPRQPDSHKGSYGRLLAICGSYGMAGAAQLCLRAALRGGVGLAEAAVPESLYPLLAPVLPEPVFTPLPETAQGRIAPAAEAVLLPALERASAVVAGCGLGAPQELGWLVRRLLKCCCPVVLDADGINALQPHMLVEETVPAPVVLTPHPGEMARLLGISVQEVQQRRAELARGFADEYGVVVVLKGHRTLVAAPGRPLLENRTGNPGMATGGSGDALAGVIGALLAQGMEPYRAAMCGVFLHGAAGDAAAARLSQHAMLPTDLIDELGGLFLKLEK